jgi:hypothetical protein
VSPRVLDALRPYGPADAWTPIAPSAVGLSPAI